MAIALVQIGSTPYRLRWRATTSGGSGGSVSRTRPQLLTDTVPGPLREAIRAALTDAQWDALNDDMRLKFTAHGVTTGLPTTPGSDSAIRWSTSPTPNVISISMGTDGTEAVFEVEFVHSMVR